MDHIKPKNRSQLRSMLSYAECSQDPGDQNAAHWLREALKPIKPRNLLDEHILGLFGEQRFAMLTNDEAGIKQIALQLNKAVVSTLVENSPAIN